MQSVAERFLAIAQNDIAIVRLQEDEWDGLEESRGGQDRFSLAGAWEQVQKLRVPTVCILVVELYGGGTALYLAVLKSKRPVTTLEPAVDIRHSQRIAQNRLSDLSRRIGDVRTKRTFSICIKENREQRIVRLPPSVSRAVLSVISADDRNAAAIESILDWGGLSPDQRQRVNSRSTQRNAVELALEIVGFNKDIRASYLDASDSESSLSDYQNRLHEDAVIAHEARLVADMSLVHSRASWAITASSCSRF